MRSVVNWGTARVFLFYVHVRFLECCLGYPLIGRPFKVRESKVKMNPSNKNNQTDGDSPQKKKKPKLPFFYVSGGELSEED